jgi:hypothetical protein
MIFFNIKIHESNDPQITRTTANYLLTDLGLQIQLKFARWFGKDTLESRSLKVELNYTNIDLNLLKLKSKPRNIEKWHRI